MSRERLMAQQRARLEAMRARKAAEKLAKAKDAKRLAPKKPLTGKKAEKALEKFLSKRTKEKPKTKATKSRPSPQAQPSTSTKSAGTKPVQKQSRVQKTVEAIKPKTGKKKSNGTGVRGNPLPSNPKLKTQPSKSKLNRQQRRKKGLLPKRSGRSPADIAKSISDKLRLTYKKGQLVRRGNKVYRSDGKGNLSLVHRKQF